MPLLLSVLIFLVVFPLNPRVLFRSHPIVIDAFFCWFFAITPITIVVAAAKLSKNCRRIRDHASLKAIGWSIIAFSVLINVMVLARLWAELDV